MKHLVINDDDEIVIERDEYYNLLVDRLKLNLLESGGVSNWENYNKSLGENFNNLKENIKKQVYVNDTIYNYF